MSEVSIAQHGDTSLVPDVKPQDTKRTPHLTDEQKKKNHIESEQKRRKAIREAFERLTELVPELSPEHSRSEILVLSKSADYLKELHVEHQTLLRLLRDKGIQVPPELQVKPPENLEEV
ncbi:Ino4p CYBJADRAFT_161516 [Cyberlindnera jadinii NRRL Y-1542]|uniref:BHLH domain-containing protein n=1 Tax=Cyberlindnera jadinii (strain ATCC 18201 / CBS 1600 / BCRC 20928 / JCM 3617 / NBRC 0987 / NRRL Y-1542) TaxID=983966 RepID=A0A1E4S6A1_CYBJN|nr:hypothetical protein CYBJADRAFT_161516 [Cyberlindnera jadinii NRRL Y-1542]ODV75041.1 hypothetical protein CYBJADRAFT_161516 [Cyberlindnera jadinii NRRL Y-1542]